MMMALQIAKKEIEIIIKLIIILNLLSLFLDGRSTRK